MVILDAEDVITWKGSNGKTAYEKKTSASPLLLT